jgi:drug/metabolite transporter (DMT)-like permease
MTFTAFFLIVCSAVLHASWNLIAKKNTMSVTLYAILGTCGSIFWLHVLFWTPIRITSLPLLFWCMVIGSVFSDVFLYCFGLIQAYKRMDMATAYPIMRALPILFTAFITSMLGLGAPIRTISIIGFFLVFCGSLLMPLVKFSDFKLSQYANKTMFFIIMVAFGTTGYTVFDSQALAILRDVCEGSGVSKLSITLTYYVVRVLVLTTTLYILVFSMKSQRAVLKDYWKKRNYSPFIAGACATMTYVLVLIAMNYVTNVSYVQVCRQLGLPIGMAAGIIFLKEESSPVKWIGVCLILIGFAVAVLCK